MLRHDIATALEQARYELLADGGGYYAEIPDCQGVYANEPTLEACRREIESVLEGWILIRVSRGLPLPTICGRPNMA